jgi:hypothetical protein
MRPWDRRGLLSSGPVSGFHQFWGYFSIAFSGLVGSWGVLMAKRDGTPRMFIMAVYAAIGALVVQVVAGVWVANTGIDPGNQHVFYGVVIAVTFTFVYIYRAQFRKRPNLYYGLLMLFAMGLGIRGVMTFGQSF